MKPLGKQASRWLTAVWVCIHTVYTVWSHLFKTHTNQDIIFCLHSFMCKRRERAKDGHPPGGSLLLVALLAVCGWRCQRASCSGASCATEITTKAQTRPVRYLGAALPPSSPIAFLHLTSLSLVTPLCVGMRRGNGKRNRIHEGDRKYSWKKMELKDAYFGTPCSPKAGIHAWFPTHPLLIFLALFEDPCV